MFTVKAQIDIDRPIEEVFGYLSNVEAIPLWRPEVLDVQASGGVIGRGAKFGEVVNFMGKKVFDMEVVEYEPNRRLNYRCTGGPKVRPNQSYTLEQTPTGTRVSFETQVTTGGAFRLMEPIFPGRFRKMWNGYLRELKAALESKA